MKKNKTGTDANSDIVNRVLASKLYDCWDMFLQGRKSLFNIAWFLGSNKNTCFICGEVSFDQESIPSTTRFPAKDSKDPNELGFYQWMEKNDRVAGETYYDAIVRDNDRICGSFAKKVTAANQVATDWVPTCWDNLLADKFYGKAVKIKGKEYIYNEPYTWFTPYNTVATSLFYQYFGFRSEENYMIFFVREGTDTRTRDGNQAYAAYITRKKDLRRGCDYISRGDLGTDEIKK